MRSRRVVLLLLYISKTLESMLVAFGYSGPSVRNETTGSVGRSSSCCGARPETPLDWGFSSSVLCVLCVVVSPRELLRVRPNGKSHQVARLLSFAWAPTSSYPQPLATRAERGRASAEKKNGPKDGPKEK